MKDHDEVFMIIMIMLRMIIMIMMTVTQHIPTNWKSVIMMKDGNMIDIIMREMRGVVRLDEWNPPIPQNELPTNDKSENITH